MLSLSAALFALASVAFAGARAGALYALASAAATVALGIAKLGVAPGIVVALALLMTAASALVLVLPPRPALARPLASWCAIAGVLACGITLALERAS